jgi:hypothetical protein
LTQHNGMIWGGTTGGPCPVQRSADGAILFSYGGSVLHQNIAINQALSGTGIIVRGYQYGWTIKNANAGAYQTQSFDPLSIRISLYDNSNVNIIETKTYDYSRRIADWTRFTGTEDFKDKYSLASLGNLYVSISSRDEGNWKGYYGPEIQQIDVRLRYSIDPCGANPLSSPTCEGYQQAYLQQQCAINTLFSQSCPGWQQAYFNQQCSINPLFGSNCPGYAAAYQNQQCSLNPLFSPACPEYQRAFFNQQCAANPLYNSTCPGYAKALFDKNCNENPLSNTSCPLYESAYLNQQCTANPLFSTACPMYQQAFFNQQCTANPLYNSGCPGYADAFRKKQVIETVTQPVATTTAVVSSPLSVPSVGNEDVVKLLTTPQVTNDPIVNQIIAKPEEKTQSSQPLGQGLSVSPTSSPGLQSRSRSSTQQSQSRSSARETARAAAVASQRSGQRDPQEVALASMAEVPGFSQYQQANIPDVPFYKSEDIYKRATIQDNARALRQLNQRSDRIHKEMVDEQYRK